MAKVIDTPLALDISHAFRAGTAAGAPRVTTTLKNVVFARDRYFCRCCGFTSKKYQEVLLTEGNARDVDNMVTVCVFCHQCFNLERVPAALSGALIWLPEFTQAQLHHIAHDIFRGRVTRVETAERARRAFAFLEARKEEARARLGTDDPGALAEELRGLTTERQRAESAERLEGVRLLPLGRQIVREADLEFNMFPQMLAYWRSRNGPFGGDVPYRWLDHFLRELVEPDGEIRNPLTPDLPGRFSHAEMSAKLLRDAAGFFRSLGERNAPAKLPMEASARTYERAAELLTREPAGRPSPATPDAGGGISYAASAAKLLREAADFFLTVGEQNPPAKELMLLNADIFRKMAARVETDPTAYME